MQGNNVMIADVAWNPSSLWIKKIVRDDFKTVVLFDDGTEITIDLCHVGEVE